MTRVVHVRQEVEISQGVKVDLSGMRVRVDGPLGFIERDFSHAKDVLLHLDEGKFVVEAFNADKRAHSVVNTIASKVRQMMTDVLRGYRYRMRVVYAHFPMSVKVNEKEQVVVIENFMGGRGRIYARILPGVKVKVEKDDVTVEGVDKEAVAQTAANIRGATRLRGKRRMCPHGREGGPGILDGIYVYAREHIK